MACINEILFCIFVLIVPQWITAMPTVDGIKSGWWYQFRAGDNSYCLMTEGQATTNNARVYLWDACDVDTETLWKAVKDSHTGTFTLMNENSHLCMTVGIDMQDTGNDSPVVQYECQNPPPSTQLWSSEIISHNHNNYMRLKSGGRCITYDPSKPRGGTMYMYDCSDAGITNFLMLNS